MIASRDAQRLGVEVKGNPSRGYAVSACAGEIGATEPSTQAAQSYSLFEAASLLGASQVQVWWVDQNGVVVHP